MPIHVARPILLEPLCASRRSFAVADSEISDFRCGAFSADPARLAPKADLKPRESESAAYRNWNAA